MFFALWTIRELWLVPYLDLMASVPRALVSATIKIGIWVIPILLLIKFMEKSNPLSFLGLRHNFNKGFKWAGVMSIALITYFISVNLIILDKGLNLSIGLNSWLNVIILVGIIEEIVFRGYLLKKFLEIYKFWKANFLTSTLFVLIHFPIWFRIGLFEDFFIIGIIATTYIVSLIFGYIYRKTGSLWSVIILHSVYNFCVVVFN